MRSRILDREERWCRMRMTSCWSAGFGVKSAGSPALSLVLRAGLDREACFLRFAVYAAERAC